MNVAAVYRMMQQRSKSLKSSMFLWIICSASSVNLYRMNGLTTQFTAHQISLRLISKKFRNMFLF